MELDVLAAGLLDENDAGTELAYQIAAVFDLAALPDAGPRWAPAPIRNIELNLPPVAMPRAAPRRPGSRRWDDSTRVGVPRNDSARVRSALNHGYRAELPRHSIPDSPSPERAASPEPITGPEQAPAVQAQDPAVRAQDPAVRAQDPAVQAQDPPSAAQDDPPSAPAAQTSAQGSDQTVVSSRRRREPPQHLLCPILLGVLVDPVISTVSGLTYSRAAIERHLDRHSMTDPITKQRMSKRNLVINYLARAAIDDYRNS